VIYFVRLLFSLQIAKLAPITFIINNVLILYTRRANAYEIDIIEVPILKSTGADMIYLIDRKICSDLN